MRIVEARPGHPEDIENGRKILMDEIEHPAKTVMIIRGNTPDIGLFADRAACRSDPFPYREVVWIKAEQLLTDDNISSWFRGHDDACAVALDFEDRPVEWLNSDFSLRLIERAFLKAQQ